MECFRCQMPPMSPESLPNHMRPILKFYLTSEMNDFISIPRLVLGKLPSVLLRGIYLSLLEKADGNGHLTISVRRFAKEIGLSYQTLRTSIAKLSCNAVISTTSTHEATRGLTQITICSLEDYEHSLRKKQHSVQRNVGTVSNAGAKVAPTYFQYGYERFQNYFNNAVNGTEIPKVLKLTAARKNILHSIFKEYGKETVELVIQKVVGSDFLSKEWGKASFDWIFKKANFIKILEGNYDNRVNPAQCQHTGRNLRRNPTAYDLACEILAESSD